MIKKLLLGLFFLMNSYSFAQQLTATAIIKNVSCSIMSDGVITVLATGGTGAYMYSLVLPSRMVGPQASNVFAGLTAGTYTIQVLDAVSNATTNLSVVITMPLPVYATATSTYDGTIIVNATGGVPQYSYSIDNGVNFQASNTFFGLVPGVYEIWVRDSNGCIFTFFKTVTFPVLDAKDDHFLTSKNANGIIGNVLTNDVIQGFSPNTSSVTVVSAATPLGQGTGVPVVDINGNVSLEPDTNPGKYTITYQLCNQDQMGVICDQAIAKINVTSKQIPAPIGNATFNFSTGATLANIPINGEGINWYAANENTKIAFPNADPLPLNTLLENGKTYYASQTINNVEGYYRLGVTTTETLAVENEVFLETKVFPNPVKDILAISNAVDIQNIEIVDSTGSLIYLEKTYNQDNIKIDFSPFQNGVYFLKINNGKGEKIFKIVK